MVFDLEFVLELRGTVSRYLRAMDAWESAYKKFARRAGHQSGLTPELEQAQAEYRAARKALEGGVPRASRVGLRYGVRDPWPGLLRASMGQSPLGRNERLAITDCLDQLMAACRDDIASGRGEESVPESAPGWLPEWLLLSLQRVKDYFL
jgi:hypothetical protein